jgi:bacillopeptidase F
MARQDGDRGKEEDDSLSLAAVTRRGGLTTPDEKLAPTLRRQLAALPPDTQLTVVVDLRDQLDPRRLAAQVDAHARTRRERRGLVVDAARHVASAAQLRVRPLLESLAARGGVRAYRGFTVVNRLVVQATPAAIRRLADHPEVSAIIPEVSDSASLAAGVARVRAMPQPEARPWALAAAGIDSARRLGLTGAGTVVGIINGGASAMHEQLRSNFRGGKASWYDPQGHTDAPVDGLRGHGTGTLSVAVGRAARGRPSIGVAPGAEWVACVGLPRGQYNVVWVTECAEWIFTTAQPDVLINPWLIADVSCDRSLQGIVNAWRAAEIFPVFAAGNEGPAASTGGSPANYVDLYPGDAVALSVGGLRRDLRVYPRSSRGPNRCNGGVYPILVAPADDITAAYPLTPTTYVRTAGTSYAAGIVAGAAALLLERHPDATVAEIEEALRSGSRDLGAPGPDQTFGYGALDVPRAVAALDRSLARRPASPVRRSSP